MPRPKQEQAYKEITLQQLRSFCETARLGSFTAAATALGLAHPTVWQQVHALEREFGEPLVEPHGRGCRITAAGQMLVALAGPSVACLHSLKRSFQATRAQEITRLVVAATPRILVEDLPQCVIEFERHWPQVLLTLNDVPVEQVPAVVESGEADLGLVGEPYADADSPWLTFEPCYPLHVILVTPQDHPLARRRRVVPRDLRAYPLVNSPTAFRNPAITAALEKHDVFREHPRRVEAVYSAVIRRYVELGFGIGLIGSSPAREPLPNFHERDMSRYFGRSMVFLVWRKGVPSSAPARALAETIRTLLSRAPAKSEPQRRLRP